jgi:regulator of protease activity HflC (stomatin/prohibitin superfamily)
MKTRITDQELGLVYKDEIFKKVLLPGVYHSWPWSKNRIAVINKKYDLEFYGIEGKTLSERKDLAGVLQIIPIKDHEIAFHYVDGNFLNIIGSGNHTFIQDMYEHRFVICDTRNINVPETVDQAVFTTENYNRIPTTAITGYSVFEGTVGALFINRKFEKILNPGRYYFFTKANEVSITPIDLRLKTLQVSGQELLTNDKVDLRVNFVLNYKVKDAVKVATGFQNYEEQLYTLVQLALREYISTKNLDELLAQKHEIGRIILDSIKNREEEYGTEFIEAGVKDIILPGDIKEILNTVLLAEKKAMANVITRREETASTRSLLNTAKLMDENETLYKLKELEYLEHIFEKVGTISLSSNGNILEQLSELIKKDK